jgi:hypothetical protein
MGEMRNTYKILVGKPERKRPLEIPRHRRENNIRMDLREVGWKDVDWMHLSQDRDSLRVLVVTVMNLRVPEKAGNFMTTSVTLSFSRRSLAHDISKVL